MKRFMLMAVGFFMVVVCASSVFAGESRFAFSRKAVEDTRTHLFWTRSADFGKLDWVAASELVKSLNKKEYAGYTDWRLPSKDELDTLMTCALRSGFFGGLKDPAPYQFFNRQGFNDAQPSMYWTSSPDKNNSSAVWVVSTYDGSIRSENKDRDLLVWPVRGGK